MHFILDAGDNEKINEIVNDTTKWRITRKKFKL